MPKNKTHSGASKRFRVTGSGQDPSARRPEVRRHNRSEPPRKPPRCTRRIAGTVEVAKADVKRAKKMLGL